MTESLAELWPAFRQRWVVYEDEWLLAVNKPAGVPVYPNGDAGTDLRARLTAWLTQRDGEASRLWLLHGLDQEASGIVLLSRSKGLNGALAKQFEGGTVSHHYLLATTAQPKRESRTQRQQNKPQRQQNKPRRQQNNRSRAGDKAQQATPQRDGQALDWQSREQRGARQLLNLNWARGGQVRRRMAAAAAAIAGDRDNGGAAATRLLMHLERMDLRHPQHGGTLELNAPRPAAFDDWLGQRDQTLPRDREALLARLRRAAEKRYAVALSPGTNAFRVVHGAGDGLPGVELDRYAEHAVLRLHEDIDDEQCASLSQATAELGFAGVYLKRRPRQANVVADTRREAIAPAAPISGTPAPTPLIVREQEVPYLTYLGDGLSTGLFLDQRHNRGRIAALSRNKRVLNLFAYHGAFSVAALAGGAAQSLTIDASATALDCARRNLDQLGADPQQHEFLCADVLQWLAQDSDDRFDVIVLDPPSYASTKTSRFSAKRDYLKLAQQCLQRLQPAGHLLASTNHRGIAQATFARWLTTAAQQAGRHIARLEQLPCPKDHPPSPDGGCHLKSILLTIA